MIRESKQTNRDTDGDRLRGEIMRRVRRVYYLKMAMHPALCRAYLLMLVTLPLFMLVSVSSILANAPGYTPLYLGHYFVKAFLHTELIVQSLTIALVLLAGWMAYDSVRMARSVSTFKRT